jgi:hypothetical protein
VTAEVRTHISVICEAMRVISPECVLQLQFVGNDEWLATLSVQGVVLAQAQAELGLVFITLSEKLGGIAERLISVVRSHDL